MKKLCLFLCFSVVCFALAAQDIHYSQFYNSPLNVNPAKTGIFNGDKRINLSYRDQWRSVPVPWQTFSASFDRKFYAKYGKKHFFSIGALFNYDVQGELTDLNLTNINLAGSWTKIMNDNNLFTVGALVGYGTRGYDSNSQTWDKQWDGVRFDATLDPGEVFETDRISFLETALGINYRWQKSRRTKLDLGIGGFHLFEPTVSFFDTGDEVSLSRRISYTGVGSFQISNRLDLGLNALYQTQEDSDEFIGSVLGKFHVNQNRGKELEFHVGLGWRSGRSWYPILALQSRTWYASINYDVDHSNFGDKGNITPNSIEAHFTYLITDVKPKVKVCPIF